MEKLIKPFREALEALDRIGAERIFQKALTNMTPIQAVEQMRVAYKDDGVGLASESLARIFDPFFSTDLQNGKGLGMHLVYNLVTHRLGGSIQCESTPGQGVHFHIEVPQ